MTRHTSDRGFIRSRWAAVGAAVAVSLGAGGIGLVQASTPAPVDVTVTISPERILDTRTDLGLAGPFEPNAPRDVQVTGDVEVATESGTASKTVVPAGAKAVLVNVTVTEPTDVGFLTLRPAGATGLPATSTVNFGAGTTEPNAATVALSGDGKVQVWVFMPTASATAQVLIDVVGYTIGHDHDDRYYTEGEIDTKLAGKADTSALAAKANTADVYTKAQVDTAIDSAIDAATPARIITVATSGGDFTSVSAALASITDASETTPYLIQVAPGVYTEASGIDLKDYVDIRGSGRNVTTITSTSDATNGATVRATGDVTSEMSSLAIVNTGGDSTAYAVRAVDVPSQSLRFTDVNITGGGSSSRYGIRLESAGAVIHNATVSAFGGGNSYAIYAVGTSSADISDAIVGANAALLASGTTSIRARDSRFTGFPTTIAASTSTIAPILTGVGLSAAVTGSPVCVAAYVISTGAPLDAACE